MDKKFWATVFTLTGTIIGAGILGLPYVFSQAGVLIGVFWLLILGFIMVYTNLCLGEIALRTKGKHQLVGYAERYLGLQGKRIMFFAVIFGVYSALIAYLIGEGQSLSQLFIGSTQYAIYFAIGFWLLMTVFLREGLKGLKKLESWGVIVIIVLVVIIAVYFSPQIDLNNFSYNNSSLFFLPFGVILFALLGFSSIPELRMEIKGSEKKFKKAIIFGTLIPIVLYIIFSLTFVGVLGRDVTEVATLSFGKLIIVLGIITMLTSYFVLSFSLNDVYEYDMRVKGFWKFFLVSLFPLLIYLGLYYLNWINFVSVLGLGGVISGGLTGILILLMVLKLGVGGDRVAEYHVPINWFVVWLLGLIFISGMIMVLFF